MMYLTHGDKPNSPPFSKNNPALPCTLPSVALISIPSDGALLFPMRRRPGPIMRLSGLAYKVLHHNHMDAVELLWAVNPPVSGTCFEVHEPFDPNRQFKPNKLVNPYSDNLICVRRRALAACPVLLV